MRLSVPDDSHAKMSSSENKSSVLADGSEDESSRVLAGEGHGTTCSEMKSLGMSVNKSNSQTVAGKKGECPRFR